MAQVRHATHRPAYWSEMSRLHPSEMARRVEERQDYLLDGESEEGKELAAQITALMIELSHRLHLLFLSEQEDSLAQALTLVAGFCLNTVEEVMPKPAGEEIHVSHYTAALLTELYQRYGWHDLTQHAIREIEGYGDDLTTALLFSLKESLK